MKTTQILAVFGFASVALAQSSVSTTHIPACNTAIDP